MTLHQINYSIARRLAHWMAWGISFVQVNRVQTDRLDPSLIVKTRTLWNWFPVMIGNIVFRFRVPAIYVMPTREWMAWETAVAQVLGQSSECVKSGICAKRMSGEPLASLLMQAKYSESQKRSWVALACLSLARLHQLQIEFPIHGMFAFSHGDAAVSNVMIVGNWGTSPREPADFDSIHSGILPETGASAIWFDFDVRHNLSVSAVARQADDLRALIFTTLVCCQWEEIGKLKEALKQSYSNVEVWEALSRKLSDGSLPCDIYHLAQLRRANLSTAHWKQMVTMIDLMT